MEAVSTPQAPGRASWTFADLASTYRFWALMVATMAVTFGALAINLALQWLQKGVRQWEELHFASKGLVNEFSCERCGGPVKRPWKPRR